MLDLADIFLCFPCLPLPTSPFWSCNYNGSALKQELLERFHSMVLKTQTQPVPTFEIPGRITIRLKAQWHLTGQVRNISADAPPHQKCSPTALPAPLHTGRLLPPSVVRLQCCWGGLG